jgi:hypothetical protein
MSSKSFKLRFNQEPTKIEIRRQLAFKNFLIRKKFINKYFDPKVK